MKIIRLIAASVSLAAITALPVYAQQQQGRPAGQQPARQAAPQTAAPAPTNEPVPVSKIAFINTQAFADEKAGITRLVNAIKGVQREFQPRSTELQTLRANYQKKVDEINKLSQAPTVVDPRMVQQKTDEAKAMETDIKRKAEDAQQAYDKREQEVAGPIYENIGKSLDAFAKQRGITMILDVSKLYQAIVMADGSMDITSAFIAEFNSKNPATASAATPR